MGCSLIKLRNLALSLQTNQNRKTPFCFTSTTAGLSHATPEAPDPEELNNKLRFLRKLKHSSIISSSLMKSAELVYELRRSARALNWARVESVLDDMMLWSQRQMDEITSEAAAEVAQFKEATNQRNTLLELHQALRAGGAAFLSEQNGELYMSSTTVLREAVARASASSTSFSSYSSLGFAKALDSAKTLVKLRSGEFSTVNAVTGTAAKHGQNQGNKESGVRIARRLISIGSALFNDIRDDLSEVVGGSIVSKETFFAVVAERVLSDKSSASASAAAAAAAAAGNENEIEDAGVLLRRKAAALSNWLQIFWQLFADKDDSAYADLPIILCGLSVFVLDGSPSERLRRAFAAFGCTDGTANIDECTAVVSFEVGIESSGSIDDIARVCQRPPHLHRVSTFLTTTAKCK